MTCPTFNIYTVYRHNCSMPSQLLLLNLFHLCSYKFAKKTIFLKEFQAKYIGNLFHLKIRGKWYISRWYLPQSKTVSDERYDWVSIVTGREGFDDRWFTNHYSRYVYIESNK